MRFLIALILAASPVFAEPPRVAADILPVHGLVSRVMDGVATPDLTLPPSASVHSYDLRPSSAAALEEADIVFWMGEALAPWLADPVRTLAGDATVVALLETEGTVRLPFREEFGHDHDHEHDHDGDTDPHAWLDPVNGAFWLDIIAETLASADPDNASIYRANAKAGQAEIAAAVSAAETILSDAEDIRYVVYHDAYQYFEARFGLSPVGAVTLGDAAPPGPARIAGLMDEMRATGTHCLLIEPQEGKSLAATLVAGAEVRLVEIDPIGSEISSGPLFYATLIESLARSFDACR